MAFTTRHFAFLDEKLDIQTFRVIADLHGS